MGTVTLVSKDNGVGLSVDMSLLEQFLVREGHTVRRADWAVPGIEPCDLIIYLELFSPHLLQYTRRSVFVPNVEWMHTGWIPQLRGVDQVWAKSQMTYRLFKGLGIPVEYTGFLTQDRYNPTVEKEHSCFHLKGNSQAKNTDAVLEAWRRFGSELPPLTIVSHADLKRPVPDNVRVLGRITYEDLTDEFNRHQFHICPSKVEGWGYYITEALTCRGVVVSSDESPMNEHVRPEWGFLVKPCGVQLLPDRLVQGVYVKPDDLAASVMAAAALSEEELAKRGHLGRAHALRRNQEFCEKARGLLTSLLAEERSLSVT